MSKSKKVSVVSVIEIIVIIILALMIAGMIAFNVIFKNDGTAAPIFGYTVYRTKAVSMVPEIPVNTVIVAKKSEIPNIKEKSVILCQIGDRTALIRVVRVDIEDDKTYYVVKFDTAPAADTFRIGSESVVAKAVWQLEAFGKFLDFATSTLGIILAVVIPLFLIIMFQVFKIVNIRKLEAEASYIDDIDDVLFINKDHDEKQPSVKLSEPKFIEDITGKINIPKLEAKREIQRERIRFEPEIKSEPVLNINSKGIAEYSVRDDLKFNNDKQSAELFTKDSLNYKYDLEKKPVAVGASQLEFERDEIYLNKPTRINQPEPKSKVDEFFDSYSGKKSIHEEEKVVFSPHISNIISEKLVNVQAEASAPKQSSFDDSVKAYFDKPEENDFSSLNKAPAAPLNIDSMLHSNTIPENAVIPKETIAPPKKKKNSKTLDELMSLIDAEENKLKK